MRKVTISIGNGVNDFTLNFYYQQVTGSGIIDKKKLEVIIKKCEDTFSRGSFETWKHKRLYWFWPGKMPQN